MKYPGGYQIIDLGGIAITPDTEVTLTDKTLLSTLLRLYEEGVNKPLYVSNYHLSNDSKDSPLLLDDQIGASDTLRAFIYDDDGKPYRKLTINIGDIAIGSATVTLTDIA